MFSLLCDYLINVEGLYRTCYILHLKWLITVGYTKAILITFCYVGAVLFCSNRNMRVQKKPCTAHWWEIMQRFWVDLLTKLQVTKWEVYPYLAKYPVFNFQEILHIWYIHKIFFLTILSRMRALVTASACVNTHLTRAFSVGGNVLQRWWVMWFCFG